jgi:hypothetical protein
MVVRTGGLTVYKRESGRIGERGGGVSEGGGERRRERS